MAFPDYRRFVHPVPGNIDLNRRPIVPDGDGYATVRSMGIGTDRGEALIPTVHPAGRIMSDDEAVDHYARTGQHLGIFPTVEQAAVYADRLHNAQERQYSPLLRGLLR